MATKAEKRAKLEKALKDPNVKAALETIKKAEGTSEFSDPYRKGFNGNSYSSLSDHPNKVWSAKSGKKTMKSSASGPYQIMKDTWYGTKKNGWNGIKSQLGLTDFSQESQDIAALHLINQKKALDPLLKGDFKTFANRVGPVWASFPNNTYGQPKKSISKLESWFKEAKGKTQSTPEALTFSDVTTDPIYNGLLGDLNATPENTGLTDLEKLGSFREAQDLQHDPVTAPTQRPSISQGTSPRTSVDAAPSYQDTDIGALGRAASNPIEAAIAKAEIDQGIDPRGDQLAPTPGRDSHILANIAAKDNAVNAGDPNRYTDSFTEYNKMVGRVDPVEKAITEEEVKQGVKPPEAMYNSLLNDELNKGLTNFDDLPTVGDYPADPPVTTPTFRPSVTTPTFRPDSFAGGDIPVPKPRPHYVDPSLGGPILDEADPMAGKGPTGFEGPQTPSGVAFPEPTFEGLQEPSVDSNIPPTGGTPFVPGTGHNAPVQQQNVVPTDTLNGSYNTERELEGRVDREDAVTRLMASESIPNGLAPFNPPEFALKPNPVQSVSTDSNGMLPNAPTPVKTTPVSFQEPYQRASTPHDRNYEETLMQGYMPKSTLPNVARGPDVPSAGLDTSYLTGDRSSQFDRAFDPFNTTNIHKSEGRLYQDGSSSSNILGPSSVNTTQDNTGVVQDNYERESAASGASWGPIASSVAAKVRSVAPSNDSPQENFFRDIPSTPIASQAGSYESNLGNVNLAADSGGSYYTSPQQQQTQPISYEPMALSADTSSLTNDGFYNGLTELDWTDPAANGMQYTDAKDAIEKTQVGISTLTDPSLLPAKPTVVQQLLGVNPNRYGTKGLLTNIAKAAGKGGSAAGPLGAVAGALFGAVNSAPKRTFDQAMSMYQNNPNMTQVKNAHNAPSRSGSFSVHTSPGGRTSVVSGKGEYGDGSYTVTSKTSDGGSVKTVRLGEGSANPGGQAATKIVCTAMLNEYGFGSYRQKIWLLYSKRYTGPAHEVGYHAMFLPLIKWAYKDKKEWVRKPLEHVVRLRTVACEDIMKKRKRWHVGHLYNTVFCAACYTLGKVITMVKKDKQPCQA